MNIFGIQDPDPDPHENLCGSETLVLRHFVNDSMKTTSFAAFSLSGNLISCKILSNLLSCNPLSSWSSNPLSCNPPSCNPCPATSCPASSYPVHLLSCHFLSRINPVFNPFSPESIRWHLSCIFLSRNAFIE